MSNKFTLKISKKIDHFNNSSWNELLEIETGEVLFEGSFLECENYYRSLDKFKYDLLLPFQPHQKIKVVSGVRKGQNGIILKYLGGDSFFVSVETGLNHFVKTALCSEQLILIGDADKLDYSVRPLTVDDSDTNTAHSIWYDKLTPVQRYELPRDIGCDLYPIEKRLSGCLNYIEDNLHKFN